MDRMLVVVFDNERKAYEAQKALLELDNEGSVSVYSYAVLAKNADGTATIKKSDDTGPLGTLAATSLGALIGVLGGPVGMAVGGAAGALSGATVDVDKARVGNDFINDVSKVLLPNRVALVAEVEEEWITPVDTRMEKLGGTVLRRAVSDVRDEQDAEYMAAMKADYDQLKSRTCKSTGRPQSQAHREDQPTRFQNPTPITGKQGATRDPEARGAGQGGDLESEGVKFEIESVVTQTIVWQGGRNPPCRV